MGRGKIEIKRIENVTNRQVTYSKRRTGLIKKAMELAVLCDAEVSLMMISSTGKLSEYISPNTTQKKMFDKYQRVTGAELWNTHYEKMQVSLKQQKEVNMKLRKEIRQRLGEGLDDMNFEELRSLEQDLDASAKVVRDRKYHLIATQTETHRKKLRNLQETHTHLVREMEARGEDPYYEGDYETYIGGANGGTHIITYRLQPSQAKGHEGAEDYGIYNLRLA
uniref:MADS transcription factor AP3-3 n=1 Tax=Adonis sutchuenensis TaxID=1882389 RepID=A0A7L7T4C9_9MAGN|nr:MADS transcription factor AP3-3 [Adonis sutchuenensis]